jgi:hypothetical protein
MNKTAQPSAVWGRIETAREALGWTDGDLSMRALKGRTHYSLLKNRGFNAKSGTQEKIIQCLEQNGYSGAWLRAGVPPERSDGVALPEPPKNATRLAQLAQKLGLSTEQVMRLWADLDTEGPLQKYPEDLQRAAFAAAYLEDRTLEDVRLAVDKARSSEIWDSKSVDAMLMAIRVTLKTIKRSGSGTLFSIRPHAKTK